MVIVPAALAVDRAAPYADPTTRPLLERMAEHCPAVLSHGIEVAALAVRLAHVLGLDDERISRLARAALLHDIGKQEIPLEVLDKPGRLDPDEWSMIERHPSAGHQLLCGAGLVEEGRIVLHHHERVDGAGYPGRLSGDDIPLEARILAVADSYDAMTSHRPYQAALAPADALAELERVRGAQCDARCVDALAAVVSL